MAGTCTCVPLVPQKEIQTDSSYTIYCPGDFEDTLENYTLIPVEKTGFVVIKNVISLDDWDDE
jgi:hypothetical protein